MGLFHEMDLAFDDIYGQFKAQIEDGDIFINFLGAPMILYCKKWITGG